MSHKKVTIALILEIWLGLNSKSLKLDHDMKNNHFGSISIRLLMLKQSASFWKLAKIGEKWGINNISAGCVKIQYLYFDNLFLFYFPCWILTDKARVQE